MSESREWASLQRQPAMTAKEFYAQRSRRRKEGNPGCHFGCSECLWNAQRRTPYVIKVKGRDGKDRQYVYRARTIEGSRGCPATFTRCESSRWFCWGPNNFVWRCLRDVCLRYGQHDAACPDFRRIAEVDEFFPCDASNSSTAVRPCSPVSALPLFAGVCAL